jgi:diketogulonate reductase-like aldo/keto reductase
MNTVTAPGAPCAQPLIIYGTAWKKADTQRLARQAIELGFRAIDTACQPKHYNEAGVGAGMAQALATLPGLTRAELFVQTKFTPLTSQDPLQLPYDPDASLTEQVSQSFATSLRNLQTAYVDSLILHSPLPDEAQTLEAWRAMEALVESGKVRQLGLSNCYEQRLLRSLYMAARVKPAALQNRFHSKTGYDRELRAFTSHHGIRYQSFWTLTANPNVLAHASVQALAERHQRTPAQVFFRYLTQIGITPLTGTSSTEHMQQDLAISEFTLQPDELAAINQLL